MSDVSTRPVSDDSFVGRLRAGEAEAFEALVRRETPRLLAVARRLLRNEEDARDAVQDGFISAFRSLDDFGGRCQVSTWLHRITVNAALMKLRSRRRKPEDPIEDLLPSFLEDGHHARHPHEWRDTGEALLASREDRAFVRAAIDRLPDSYRTVLLLRDIEELDTAEVAQVLGVSDNVVKVRLHRARQALRTLLAPRFEKGNA
jgi:RNA polymerase sigma-70 factor (ECF subfamily)